MRVRGRVCRQPRPGEAAVQEKSHIRGTRPGNPGHVPDMATPAASGDCETRRVGLSGAVASLVFVVPHVTRLGTGRFCVPSE